MRLDKKTNQLLENKCSILQKLSNPSIKIDKPTSEGLEKLSKTKLVFQSYQIIDGFNTQTAYVKIKTEFH